MKILLVEDQTELCELLTRSLTKERYLVETAQTLRAAKGKIGVYEYDVYLLDIMLPDGNGLELIPLIRERDAEGRILILSAKDAVEDRVEGLELGADDYLPKPFHLSELHARMRSLLRRNRSTTDRSIRLGNVCVQPEEFSVSIEGTPLLLNRKEYDILHYFLLRPNHLISKTALAEAVWGDNIDQADSFDFIYAQVKNLRRKLKDAGASIGIKAVYGVGYRLVHED
ncbi:MAG: response regulator transcription factor [Bacteroidales bacterium]|nr:response regulator transcription factor [Bacteroidales bacterium]